MGAKRPSSAGEPPATQDASKASKRIKAKARPSAGGSPASEQPSKLAERLHKRIANSGLCSRRAAEKLIAEGRVAVNGSAVTEMGVKVGPSDEIRVDGKPLDSPKFVYLAMNKPAGYLTTLSDPFHRKTVAQLLPRGLPTLKPVGRLDLDTEGLLLFTNDGELAHRLSHPRHAVEKEYEVAVEGMFGEKEQRRLEAGVSIEGRKTAPARIEALAQDEDKRRTLFRIVIHEGRKRQVRLMCEAVGHPVRSLKRVRMGSVSLGSLKKGMCRLLEAKEVAGLRASTGLS